RGNACEDRDHREQREADEVLAIEQVAEDQPVPDRVRIADVLEDEQRRERADRDHEHRHPQVRASHRLHGHSFLNTDVVPARLSTEKRPHPLASAKPCLTSCCLMSSSMPPRQSAYAFRVWSSTIVSRAASSREVRSTWLRRVRNATEG